MDRVSNMFLEVYNLVSTKELKVPVIFVGDLSKGFVIEGALFDE